MCRFHQAHVMHTQCSPSRCTMLTGRYMHVLGHRTQTHLVQDYEMNYYRAMKEVKTSPMMQCDSVDIFDYTISSYMFRMFLCPLFASFFIQIIFFNRKIHSQKFTCIPKFLDMAKAYFSAFLRFAVNIFF